MVFSRLYLKYIGFVYNGIYQSGLNLVNSGCKQYSRVRNPLGKPSYMRLGNIAHFGLGLKFLNYLFFIRNALACSDSFPNPSNNVYKSRSISFAMPECGIIVIIHELCKLHFLNDVFESYMFYIKWFQCVNMCFIFIFAALCIYTISAVMPCY